MDGLMRFMDLHKPTHITAPIEHGLDDELANRWVLLFVPLPVPHRRPLTVPQRIQFYPRLQKQSRRRPRQQ